MKWSLDDCFLKYLRFFYFPFFGAGSANGTDSGTGADSTTGTDSELESALVPAHLDRGTGSGIGSVIGSVKIGILTALLPTSLCLLLKPLITPVGLLIDMKLLQVQTM